jgi:phosphoribosylamine---glycine ligase
MRFLIIDVDGFALDIAMRAQDAGHTVKHFIRQCPKTDHIGRGLIDIVNDFVPWLHWADLIFLAANGRYVHALDNFRKDNPKARVIAPTVETQAWELNRAVGQVVMRKADIPTLPCSQFDDYDAAIAFVKRKDERFVSKPSGDGSEDKALSYVSKTPEDMVYMLQRWKKTLKNKTPFILQPFVAGIEMAVGIWHGPHGFNSAIEENFEFKKLMAGDLGQNTGEMGTVMRFVNKSKLADKVLFPLKDQLKKAGYVGNIDVNCIIDKKGVPWPLEFTMRPGWPAFNIETSARTGDPIQWLADLADGKDTKNLIMNQVHVGVILAIPDFPYSHITRKEVWGIPVYGANSQKTNVHFCEMQQTIYPQKEGNKIVDKLGPSSAGDYLLVATGHGETVRNARSQAYRILSKLEVPNSPMWRIDIGTRLKNQIPELQKQGYATGMQY